MRTIETITMEALTSGLIAGGFIFLTGKVKDACGRYLKKSRS